MDESEIEERRSERRRKYLGYEWSEDELKNGINFVTQAYSLPRAMVLLEMPDEEIDSPDHEKHFARRLEDAKARYRKRLEEQRTNASET